MQIYRGVEVELHVFLAPALDGGEFSALWPSIFTPGKESPVSIG
jgi:hypothetical protein